jgi:phosphoribosylformylglycinamidine synthase
MKVGVVRFPGSNCDQDALYALEAGLGVRAAYCWHEASDLSGFDAIVLPGGFTYGDYLRCGAIAAHSPVVAAIKEFVAGGKLVLGICNGFQVLCEAGILPGALTGNVGRKFLCQDVYLRAEPTASPWTHNVSKILRIPIAHGEGRYVCDANTLERLEADRLVAFRYVTADGERSPMANPNGSMNDIAGIVNPEGNVLGMMPHPERASFDHLGCADGLQILSVLSGACVAGR